MDGDGDDQFSMRQSAAAGDGDEKPRGVASQAGAQSVSDCSGVSTASFDPLAAAVNALPDGFGVIERVAPALGVVDFVWTRANPALSRLMGGGGLIGCYVGRDHADGGCGGQLLQLLSAAAAAPKPQESIVAMAGGYRRVLAQGYGFPADPGPAAYISVTVTDFAATRWADPLRVALEHSQDAIALFDAQGRLVDATGRLRQLFPEIADLLIPGASMDDLLKRFGAVSGDNENVSIWAARRLALRRGGTTTFRSPAGLWLRNSEWRTPDGGVISIFTDVTAFKEQEERLRASEASALTAQQQAETASRAKSDFLTHMSHELRTPLNAVIGFAELLALETLGPLGNPRYISYVRDILDSGKRLLELVDDALNLSRIDAGRVQLVEEMIDIGQEIAAVALKAGAQARKREIILSTEARGLPLLVADRRAIHQMIEHLLSNALKFTQPQGSVLISASLTPDGGVGLMVADTGAGIADEDLEKVVLPFGRTEMSMPHHVDGTGLGLPVVKRLIELHGGRLDLSSTLGVGTTAILIFPAGRVVRPQLAPFPLQVIGA